jgi:surface antigen
MDMTSAWQREMTMRIVALVAAAGLLAGCAGGPEMNKTNIGGVLGGIGGAVAGAQFGSGSGRLVGVAAGTILGALLGQSIGGSLDRADQSYAQQAHQRAQNAPIGETITWSNPSSGNRGMVVATREGTNQSTGEYCREFQHEVQVGGKGERAYGTACRQPDGSWRIVQ